MVLIVDVSNAIFWNGQSLLNAARAVTFWSGRRRNEGGLSVKWYSA